MPYQWTDQETIQSYLIPAGNLCIGENREIEPSAAENFENDSVFEIRTLLSAAWTGIQTLNDQNTPADLKRMAAKLTASRLGGLRTSGRIGESPQWIERYRSEVIAQAQRMIINFKTVDVFDAINTITIRQDVTIAGLLLLIKQREFAPQPPA